MISSPASLPYTRASLEPFTLLQGADALHETFVQNVSHELRTPLALVMGYAELLHDQTLGELAPAQQDALNIILKRSQQIQTIVERVGILLSNQADMTAFSPLKLEQIVGETVEKFRPDFAQAQIELRYTAAANGQTIMGDENHLRHLTACLLDNALKFTPANNEAAVTVTADNDQLRLIVADTGIGMNANTVAAIQQGQRFFQADPSATRQYGGLGLGLTLVNAVTQAHQGRLEIATEPGQGSRFTVSLPVLDEKAAARPLATAASRHAILVVDDEPDVALVMQRALQRLPNCEVMTAGSAAEALALCRQRQFDLLLTDYNMPGDDGVSLIKQARQQWPGVLAIMITAHDTLELRRLAVTAAVDRVLDKRVKIAEIQQAVQETLRQQS
jgi:two-component system, chemotaxis family, CheB/CheR fusion protein